MLCHTEPTCEQFHIKFSKGRFTSHWIKNIVKHYLFTIPESVHLKHNLFATNANQNKTTPAFLMSKWKWSHQESSRPLPASYQIFVGDLTAWQPYATRSLSSVITATIPPFSGSRLHRYANWASASYGATTYSMFSDLRTWKVTSDTFTSIELGPKVC